MDRPYGAVLGVLGTVLSMIEAGDTYLGVATDHVIESFRNKLWAGDKMRENCVMALVLDQPRQKTIAFAFNVSADSA